MPKNFFAYFFIIVLSTAIIVPTCISFLELSSEISLVLDIDEDIEDIEIKKDTEIKFLFEYNPLLNYTYTTNKNKIIFLAKEYSSVFRNLDSPPPDFYS